MAKKTGGVKGKRKRSTPRDLRPREPAAAKGGSYTAFPGFAGGVTVAAGDVNNDGKPGLKLAK
jgi:hypothetical protein